MLVIWSARGERFGICTEFKGNCKMYFKVKSPRPFQNNADKNIFEVTSTWKSGGNAWFRHQFMGISKATISATGDFFGSSPEKLNDPFENFGVWTSIHGNF